MLRLALRLAVHRELHAYSVCVPSNTSSVQIKASVLMSQDFPLTLEHVTPMLEVMSMQVRVRARHGGVEHVPCLV